MKDIFLTFGIDFKGNLVSINETPSGATELRCPWCKQVLIAKKGEIKKHHFAHHGETCRISQEIAQSTQIPTFDTFELLDSHEAQYLERRAKYGSHQRVYRWNGIEKAVDRLEAMEIIKVEKEVAPLLEEAVKNLKSINSQWIDGEITPSKMLIDLFDALNPLVSLEHHWNSGIKIKSTKIDRNYNKNQFKELRTLADLDRAQRYWFDAFSRRQQLMPPEYQDFLNQKIKLLNNQNLYVMRFTGEFLDLPNKFIKVGISTRRDTDLRLQEVLGDLKQYGSSIKGEILAVKKGAGRLERLLHRFLASDNLKIGRFTEFFKDNQLPWLLSQIKKTEIGAYTPPKNTKSLATDSNDTDRVAGRRKKSNLELLAEYEDIVSSLQSGKGVRETSRLTQRSVNTVQKVKVAMAAFDDKTYS